MLRSALSSLDAFDLVVLLTFGAMAAWLPINILSKRSGKSVWLGLDGPNSGDQLQYLGWVQRSSHTVLISNPFDTASSTPDFLHPGLAASGLLARLGLPPAAAYYVWIPIGVVALFVAVRALTRRALWGTAARRCALVMALLWVSPVLVNSHLTDWLSPIERFAVPPVVSDMWPVSWTWGYPFSALSLAFLCFAVIAYDQDRRAKRVGLWAPLCGLFCGWLMPWAGATLLGVVVGTEAFLWVSRRRASLLLPVVMAVATGLPLVYYAVLSRVDPAWALAGRANAISIPAMTYVVVLLPLGLPALLAYRLPPKDVVQIMLRLWPIMVIAQIFFTSWTGLGTFNIHAVEGLTIPMAILAVIGVRSVRVNVSATAKLALGIALLAIVMVVPLYDALDAARGVGLLGASNLFVRHDEYEALQYLKSDPAGGGVLSPVYLGAAVPAVTGRATWVGIYSWTPSYVRRAVLASELFSGGMSAAGAEDLIRASRARFLLADCQHHADVAALVPTLVETPRRFGCAAVYRVK